MTAGVLSVNPNTMYPLLRQLERRGLIEGKWEHPERRTRRYYSLTADGAQEYERLSRRCGPSSTRSSRSIDEIVRRGLRDVSRAAYARGDRAAAAGRGARALDRRRSLADLRRGLRARRRALSGLARAGAELVWESSPGGRGRVTEKVVERASGQLRDRGLRGRAAWAARRCGRSARRRRAGRADLEYELVQRGPLQRRGRRPLHPPRPARRARGAPRALRGGGRGGGWAPLAVCAAAATSGGSFVRFQGRRRRRRNHGRGDRPGDRRRRHPGRPQGRRAEVRRPRPGEGPRGHRGPARRARQEGEDHPGAGRRAARGDPRAASPARPTTRASATSTS